MLLDGMRIMMVGMAVVFAFLSLLVLAMQWASKFFERYARFFPEEKIATSGLDRIGDDHADIAAVVAAVTAYTKR